MLAVSHCLNVISKGSIHLSEARSSFTGGHILAIIMMRAEALHAECDSTEPNIVLLLSSTEVMQTESRMLHWGPQPRALFSQIVATCRMKPKALFKSHLSSRSSHSGRVHTIVYGCVFLLPSAEHHFKSSVTMPTPDGIHSPSSLLCIQTKLLRSYQLFQGLSGILYSHAFRSERSGFAQERQCYSHSCSSPVSCPERCLIERDRHQSKGPWLSLPLFCCAQPCRELWLVAIVRSLHCSCCLTSSVQRCFVGSHSRAAEGQGG